MDRKNLQGAITSDDLLGKDVIDVNGAIIGVSDKIYINRTSLHVIGISVDKGFLRTGFIIGSKYIKQITEHAVFLNIRPSALLKGKTVFGNNGAKVGVVKDVELTNGTNTVKAIIVAIGLLHKPLRIPAEYIESKDQNIFLNVSKAQLRERMRASP